MYRDGKGVPQDLGEAVKWFSLAAKQNDPDAQFSLGCMYAAGNGVQQNVQEALKWLQRSADQGNQDAKAFLSEFIRRTKDS